MLLWKTISIQRMALLFVFLAIPAAVITPFMMGVLESRTNKAIFSDGRCRLDNTMKVLSTGDRSLRLVSGVVILEDKTEFNHLWGVNAQGKIIDVTCNVPVTRRTIAILNPWRYFLPVEFDNSRSTYDKIQSIWNRVYLFAFVRVKGGSRRF